MNIESGSIFKYTLVISLAAHGVIFFKAPPFSVKTAKLPETKVEFNYVKETIKPEVKPKKQAKNDPFLKLPQRVVANERVPPPFDGADSAPKINRAPADRGRLLQNKDWTTRATAVKDTISLSSPDINISKNPAYISYYQISREKIRRCAYQQNYGGREEGEVTVAFVIARDGTLSHVRLVEGSSCPSAYLRNIAVSSVKEAAPFPKFPKELDYPQIPFTLSITFQN